MFKQFLKDVLLIASEIAIGIIYTLGALTIIIIVVLLILTLLRWLLGF